VERPSEGKKKQTNQELN